MSRFLTNEAFSEQEQVQIQQLLSLDADELQNVEEEIARLTQLRIELSTNIHHYKVAVAPWKRIPEHVLQLIFLSCLSSYEIVGRWSRSCLTPITAVCSFWRKVALNTPELWQAISVEFDRFCAISLYDRRFSVACRWLSRASNRARSLKIDISAANHADFCPEFCDEMIDRLVLPFTFRSLDLTIGWYHRCYRTIEGIFSLPHECTQSLNELVLRVQNSEATFNLNGDQGRFPNLQTLHMEGLLQSHQILPIIPWQQLRQLSLTEEFEFLTSAFQNILHQCVALEKLTVIMGSRRNPELSLAPPPLVIPGLREINLSLRDEIYRDIFVASLVLPRIEEFVMSGYAFSGNFQSFIDMAQRSPMPQLQRLHLGGGRIPYNLRDLLKHTPSLTHLKVDGNLEFDLETLEDLLTGRLGPNLEEIVSPNATHTSGINVGRLINGLLRVRPRWSRLR